MIIPFKNWLALFVAIGALIGWPCAAAAAPKPVVIGAPLPLTGDLKEFGRIMKNSLEMAGEAVNQAGGINGSPVKLLFTDDRGQVSLAEEVVNDLTAAGSVMMVGGYASDQLTAWPNWRRKGPAVSHQHGFGRQNHPARLEEHLPAQSADQRIYQRTGRFLGQKFQTQIHGHHI